MNQNYLLTYQCPKRCHVTFAWFETEEELYTFIEENNVQPIEAFKIISAEELEV